MSLINTYVSISQFCRRLASRVRNKLIAKLQAELARTENDLFAAEEKRSENMVKLHQEHYKAAAAIGEQKAAELDALYKKFDDMAAAEVSRFTVAKASIAVVSQAIADDLKSRRAALSSELDKLVG
ncbi:hypothetical protein Kp7_17 [Klebsiella phage Kp7]|uniref:Uncharacterized protein n=1 Tax=Klebsiella phage Kp7 TaxID=2936515 RepID=A0AAE9KXJ0_9CAUD|nr:hypothetical protein Kp7_17 [Klebsiella phage Kp7]